MDSLHTPFTVFGYVMSPGDLHVSSYLRFLSRKFEAYKDVQVFCLRESFLGNGRESLDDIVDGATLVVGVLPSNDLDVLRGDAEMLKAAMVAEGLPTSNQPQFVCGVDCWQVCYDDDSSDEEDEDDYEDDEDDEDEEDEGKTDDDEECKENF